jgi:hypothetical protein
MAVLDTRPPGRDTIQPLFQETHMIRKTRSAQGRAATFGVPHSNECLHLTTYPRKIKHLHDDT